MWQEFVFYAIFKINSWVCYNLGWENWRQTTFEKGRFWAEVWLSRAWKECVEMASKMSWEFLLLRWWNNECRFYIGPGSNIEEKIIKEDIHRNLAFRLRSNAQEGQCRAKGGKQQRLLYKYSSFKSTCNKNKIMNSDKSNSKTKKRNEKKKTIWFIYCGTINLILNPYP